MTYKDAVRRAVATFVYGATASPVAAGLLSIATWKAAAVAGVGALWNLAHRSAQAYLASDAPVGIDVSEWGH